MQVFLAHQLFVEVVIVHQIFVQVFIAHQIFVLVFIAQQIFVRVLIAHQIFEQKFIAHQIVVWPLLTRYWIDNSLLTRWSPSRTFVWEGGARGKGAGESNPEIYFRILKTFFSLRRSTFQYPENWGKLKEIMAVLMNVMSKIANIVNSCRKVTLAEDDFSLGPFKKTFYSIFINDSILTNWNVLVLHPMTLDFILGIFSGLFLFSKPDCNSLRVSNEWD